MIARPQEIQKVECCPPSGEANSLSRNQNKIKYKNYCNRSKISFAQNLVIE